MILKDQHDRKIQVIRNPDLIMSWFIHVGAISKINNLLLLVKEEIDSVLWLTMSKGIFLDNSPLPFSELTVK